MMENKIVCKERYGTVGKELAYIQHEGKDTLTVLTYANKTLTNISQFFMAVFLPQGYPESVSNDYLIYQMWDTMQAFASSITNTLATQAVLKGIGVGKENATAMAATITWLLKDGTGMVGKILFAWCQGSDLDCNCKQWRLFADVLNDFAICLELVAPNFTDRAFTPVLCVAGLCKSLVGVAGGATRAALIQHQARRDNLADITAKDGSQETLVNLAALIFSLILIPSLSENQRLIWMFFFTFTALHLFANYMAVKSITIDYFNQSRFHILVQHYTQTGGDILSIESVNRQEPVLFPKLLPLKINLGSSFGKLTTSLRTLQKLCERKETKYLININFCKKEINVVFHTESSSVDQLKAFWEAMIICICYDNIFKGMRSHYPQLEIVIAEMEQSEGIRNTDIILNSSREFVNTEFPIFMNKILSRKWILNTSQFGICEWRAEWNVGGLAL